MTSTSASLAPSAGPPLLGTALALDAVVTGANGAAYLVLAGPLADLLGVPEGALRGVGAFLLAFAVAVWFARGRAVGVVIAVNAAWAAASIAAAVAGLWSPTTAGTVWIVLQAVVVAGFAELQLVGLRRARR